MQIVGETKLNAYGVEVQVAKVLHAALTGGTPAKQIAEGIEAARQSFARYVSVQPED